METQVAGAETAGPKTRRQIAEAVLSFDEFVARIRLSQVWADGLHHNLTATSTVDPRSLSAWQDALAAFQAQS